MIMSGNRAHGVYSFDLLTRKDGLERPPLRLEGGRGGSICLIVGAFPALRHRIAHSYQLGDKSAPPVMGDC
jgi:hypothetical protein